ncbi:MAG: LytTR family transcriptional regulator [Muribaculaceae bacterium]|nr:LytTR family transcriptional regulator [Muribaculaceae bacterium]MDE6755015.1 LytTR family transcriptional regulator [Muribaculaceae bacterium]
MTLREVEEMLPAEIFMRVHRSFIVNIPSVEIVERNRIVFGKTYIPISENKREEFFSRLGK